MALQERNEAVGADTSSRGNFEIVKGSHHFTLNGFSLAKGMGIGQYVSSEIFTAGGYEWALYVYPDGMSAEDMSTYISVFIVLVSDSKDVRALFELTLLDQTDNKKHKTHSHFEISPESGPYTLRYRGSMWGYKRFLNRAFLETADYLKNDTISFKYTVGVVVTPTLDPKLPVPELEPEIDRRLEALSVNAENDATLGEEGV